MTILRNAALLVAEGVAVSAYQFRARILLKAPFDQARRMVSPTIAVVERQRGGMLLADLGASMIKNSV